MTNRDLQRFHNELKLLKSNGSIFYYWEEKRIKEFWKRNVDKINALTDRLNRLSEEYVIFENGIPKTEMVEGKVMSKLKEGKEMKDFQEAYSKIMDEPVTIILNSNLVLVKSLNGR